MKQPSLDALPVFRSVMQAQMLGLLLSNPERPWSNKELAERLDAELRTVAKETRRLARAGLLKSESVGKTLLYSAAADSPFYRPLLELVDRSVGPVEELKRRLQGIAGIDVAVIFGSWGRGTDLRPTSDIDVLVVGNAAYEDIADVANDVEALAGREVQLIVYSRKELDQRTADDSGFVKDVLRGPLTPLVGDPDTLRRRRR